MDNQKLKWFYLVALSLVWGSSFILIKKGLLGLTPLQLGALRTFLAGIFLLLIGAKSLRKIKKHQWRWIVVSALLGTFFPAFLFAFAELKINSAIVSILNSTVPILSIIFGFLIFKIKSTKKQVIGVVIGLLGSVLLIGSGANINSSQDLIYAFLPLVATTMYAINVHVIKRYLQDVPALSITVGCFSVLMIPATIVLYFADFFTSENLNEASTRTAIVYIAILSVVGTGIAKVLFNKLVQISNPVFSTSVTYLIPIVALSWGILDGEKFGFLQVISGMVILFGVYMSNRKKKIKKPTLKESAL
ncbi:DMT family transporter [Mesonia aestuariivivens]|uniref:EamA family transporter n=1 Tax=Mesonia aestuariivivens TaxID=2796128 RepID=A0ABS6VXT0_9FLAO|nr:EamA family transporter [Mesonia aestuariivivens]MBW2960366.1 EamA family transporter [Mesonia aestuariivivens]